MNLKGKNIVITGANQGLGKSIALACLREGANLFLCARNAALLDTTRTELLPLAAAGQQIYAEPGDVSHADDVQRVASSAIARLGSIDGLVNNAGVYGPIGPIETVDWNEWRYAIEVNLMGTVLFCRALLPAFRKQGRGRIVNLSGGGATAPLPRFSAYAASKAAVVRFTETLAQECSGTEICVNAIAPGALNTRLLDQVIEAGPELAGNRFYERSLQQKQEGGAPLEKGADLCVFLLSDASKGITGRLLSAVWDPWRDLPARIAELSSSDIYTLRRIVPKDRGVDWED